MFSEWSDPYDIDEYYDDLYNAYKDVIPTKQSTKPAMVQPVVPSVIEEPVKQIINGPAVKSGFEVVPNSIFMDGHPVGSQPSYNILRSGPEKKETESKETFMIQSPSYLGMSCGEGIGWVHILIFIAFVFFICIIAQMRAQLNHATMTMKMLTIMYSHEKYSKKD